MAGLLCMTDCAEATWDFVSGQLLLAAGFWGALVVLGLMLTFFGRCVNVDRLKERMDRCRSMLQDSFVFSALYGIVSVAQCVLFSLRTLTKTADYVTFSLDALACLLFLMNLFVSWMRLFLQSAVGGLGFMGTWALLDCVMIPSVVCLAILEVDGAKTWFSFSYMSALHVLEAWRWLLEIKHVNMKELKWQVIDVTVSIVITVYFAAMMVMTLENLGDPEILQGINEDKWNFVASLYFVFVTLSTVGYGDLAPATALGRGFVILTIFMGLSCLLLGFVKIVQVFSLHSQGGGHFTPPPRTKHIVVSGNPTVQMIKDFISELFHPDHAEDALDLHLVFLLPRGTNTMMTIQKYLRLKENLHVAARVHLRQGSVLENADLSRVSPTVATAFFVLPNIQCRDLMHEDTENIMRMMAVLKVVPAVRMILLLMRAEHEQLLHDTGMGTVSNNLTVLSMDQFKLELVGKSCQVPGFATLICNLFKTISGSDGDIDLSSRGLAWLQDYDQGAENELYEVELSDVYTSKRMHFSEIVLDVLAHTEGKVYLIGIVEAGVGGKRVLVNPGTFYKVKSPLQGISTAGIFIAADRAVVKQREQDIIEMGRAPELSRQDTEYGGGRKGSKGSRRPSSKQRSPLEMAVLADQQKSNGDFPRQVSGESAETQYTAKSEADAKARTASKSREDSAPRAGTEIIKRIVDADPLHELVDKDAGLNGLQKSSAKHLMLLAKKQRSSLRPTPPTMDILAKGGHILFLCLGAQGSNEFRLGAEHFLKPLRGDHVKDPVPLVLMAPVAPHDWGKVSDFAHVFFLKGSPLSLFDLERASFRAASVIFVCHVGSPTGLTEQWMVDSEVICCTRLLESELPMGGSNVIVELTVDMNHPFVVHVQPKTDGRRAGVNMGSAHIRMGLSAFRGSLGSDLGPPGGRKGMLGFGGQAMTLGPVMDNGKIMEIKAGSLQAQPADYYRQPRFACGQLFVGNVVTSLVVNCYFNPTLWEFLHTMISQEVVMVPVKYLWEGKSYREYFEHLMKERALLAVAIYRVAEGPRDHPESFAGENSGFDATAQRRWSYVFAAPPADANQKLLKGDSVICFGPTFATHKLKGKKKEEGASSKQRPDLADGPPDARPSQEEALAPPPPPAE